MDKHMQLQLLGRKQRPHLQQVNRTMRDSKLGARRDFPFPLQDPPSEPPPLRTSITKNELGIQKSIERKESDYTKKLVNTLESVLPHDIAKEIISINTPYLPKERKKQDAKDHENLLEEQPDCKDFYQKRGLYYTKCFLYNTKDPTQPNTYQVEALKKKKKIEIFEPLNGASYHVLLPVLKRTRKLRYLEIYNQFDMTDAEYKKIFEALAENQDLTEDFSLVLSNLHNLGSESLSGIEKLISKKKIHTFYLQATSDSYFDKKARTDFGDYLAEAISKSIPKHAFLKQLNLRGWGLQDDKGVFLLAKMLLNNKSLRYLTLDNNGIGNRGFTHICNALKLNTSLLELSLSQNDIDDAAMNEFYNALRQNKTLKIIKLDRNRIRDLWRVKNETFDAFSRGVQIGL